MISFAWTQVNVDIFFSATHAKGEVTVWIFHFVCIRRRRGRIERKWKQFFAISLAVLFRFFLPTIFAFARTFGNLLAIFLSGSSSCRSRGQTCAGGWVCWGVDAFDPKKLESGRRTFGLLFIVSDFIGGNGNFPI